MAVRMSVQQAADLWRVNRRTILKWIMGKDSTGRGKRLVEGEDYETIDTEFPGRKMYVLLRETYPVPTINTTPIPRKPRGRRGPRGAPAVGVPHSRFEARADQAVAPAPEAVTVVVAPVEQPVESIQQIRNHFDREVAQRFVPPQPVAPPQPKPRVRKQPVPRQLVTQPVVEAEPEVMVPPEVEPPPEALVEPPKPKRVRRPKEEVIPTIDTTYMPTARDLPEDVEPSAQIPSSEGRQARQPDPSYEGQSIKDQLSAWVLTLTDDPDEQERPLAAAPRVILREAIADAGSSDASDFARLGQPQVERYLRRVLNSSPMTAEARTFAGGMVLEFLQYASGNKFKLTPSREDGGYWPKTGQLSGLRVVDPAPLSQAFPPYDWM